MKSTPYVVVFLLASFTNVGFAEEPKPNLNASLREHQRRHLARGQQIRDDIHSLEDLKAYQTTVRENFRRILGPWPDRTPLKAKVTGVLQRDGYRIEKILIQSQPGFYVTINLYVPTGQKEPMPAVLSPLGHAPSGKAHQTGDNYQARFITLARKGYVVCTYDPLGQGEREAYAAKTGNHHYIQGYQCMPSARHFAQYFIWDGIRCLDYLETRPEVDKKRIACSGCSGGGTLTNYIAAMDQRVAVAVPASWVTDSITLTEDRGLHTESWFPDMCAPYGPGTRQLLACIAPRPLLILGNRDDAEFPPDQMEAVYRDLQKLYRQVGVEDQVEYVSVPTPHGYWPEARRELYRFVNKWFDREEAGSDEPAVTPEEESDLFCAPGGQVRNLPGAETVYSLNRQLMADLRKSRESRRAELAPDKYRDFIRQGILQSTLYVSGQSPIRAHAVESSSNEPHDPPERIVIEIDTGFHANAELYEPEKPVSKMVALLIADDNAHGSQLAGELRAKGFRVLHLHTTTTGDRRAIMSGKPRCGRWINLILRGTDFLQGRPETQSSPVVAMGIGWAAAISAQMAGIVEPDRIHAVAALGELDSIESLSEGIDESHSLQMLPGMLRWFDETDLAAALAPVPQWIADTRDKQSRPLAEGAIANRHKWCRQRYAAMDHTEQLVLAKGPGSSARLVDWLLSQVEQKQGE